MLDTLFTSVLSMTIKGSFVILSVLLTRLLLHRAPKVISYGLWLVVLLRLLCPVSVQLPVSALPEVIPVTPNHALDDADISFAEVGAAAIGSLGDLVSGGSGMQKIPVKPQTDSQTSVQQPQVQQPVQYISASAGDIMIFLCAYLWIAGFTAMAAYSLLTAFRLKRNLREAILVEKGVYQTDRYDTPFVMGLLKPRIYLPQGLEGNEKLLILTHEKHHIRRLDTIWKALGFLALSIHWFNPLVWVAFICACRDMEMSCDEAVLKSMGEDVRGEYAASLLKITTGRRIIAGAPLAFGEGDPKGRIRNLAKWKKPILWISVAAVVVCTALALCLLTDPMDQSTVSGGNVFFLGYLDVLEDEQVTLACEDGSELKFDLNPEFVFPEDVQTGDYVMIRGRWNEEDKCYLLSRTEKIDLPAYRNMDEAIEKAVLLVEDNLNKDQYACVSFAEIADKRVTDRGGEIVTVYGFALYQVYTNSNGKLLESSGSHIPVAITFRMDSGGDYHLASYWMPRDGSYYVDDIRRMFPGGRTPDGQKYIGEQKRECEEKAREFFADSMQQTVNQGNAPVYTDRQLRYGEFYKDRVPDSTGVELSALGRDYSKEDAIRDGVVVMKNQNAYANADIWEDFYQKTQKGEPSSVRIMECGEDSYNYVADILFDGRSFLLIAYECNPYDLENGAGDKLVEHHYSTLHRYEGINYICYGLSWQSGNWEHEPAWSVVGNGGGDPVIAFRYLLFEIPRNPQLPETLVSAKLMLEDLVMGTVTDPQKLESLRNMLANAEYDPEVKTYFAMEELYLDLVFSDGTRLQLTMFPELDRILSDGLAYDYGPWDVVKKDGDYEYMGDYNALLDLVRHFGLEDWPKEFSQWCIDHNIEPPRHSLKVLVGEAPYEH